MFRLNRNLLRRTFLFGSLGLGLPRKASPLAPKHTGFIDIAKKGGVSFRHSSSHTSQKYLPESMGAGVAMLDYDNDGHLDIFFVNGAALSDPMGPGQQPDKSNPQYWNRLYR